MIWHPLCTTVDMSSFSGQIILVGTAICEGFDARVAKGARCAMICVCDCDTLSVLGQMEEYETEEGFDAGRILDATLGQCGWTNITVSACLPVAEGPEGWEPELAALIITARQRGIAHMVFEADATAPRHLH
jgi:hypothetical protein